MSVHNHITFICSRCDYRQDRVAYEQEASAIDGLTRHLEAAHGVDEEARDRLTRGAAGHADGDEWFEWDYLFCLDGQPLARKIIRQERAADDLMRFA